MQIVPAILVKSQKEFEEKVKAVEPYVEMIQLDIMDNRFVPNKTWGTPVKIKRTLEDINFQKDFEVHLMVMQPEKFINPWSKAGAKRIIFHYESTKRPKFVIEKIIKNKCEVGVAINPKTPVSSLKSFMNEIDMILVMGVDPGFSGQKFQKSVLEKIKEIKKLKPDILVEVDGGVNLKTAKDIAKAGTDVLAAASAIFKSGNVEETIKILKKI